MSFRRFTAAAWIITLAIAVQATAFAESAADAKKKILAIYAKRDAAVQKRDINGSLAAMAPDFQYVTKDGQKGNIGALKTRLTPLFRLMQGVKSKSDILTFKVTGKKVVATVKQHLEMLVVNPQTQVPQKLVADATSEDLWTGAGSNWLQTRMTAKAERATLNGKPLEGRIKSEPGSQTPGKSPHGG